MQQQQQQPHPHFHQAVRIPNPNFNQNPHQVIYRFHQVRPPGPPVVANLNHIYPNPPRGQFQLSSTQSPYPDQRNFQFFTNSAPNSYLYSQQQTLQRTLPTVPQVPSVIVHPYLTAPSAIISPPIDEDRYAETPMVMPVECELGRAPDTPSTSPDIPESKFADAIGIVDDTSELLRLQLIENSASSEYTTPPPAVLPYVKRHRRTKKKIIEDRQKQLKSQLKGCSVVAEKMDVSKSVRLFYGGSEIMIKDNLPNFASKMKFVPNKFMKVVNIGCMKTKKGIIYSCLRDHCKFKSYDKEVFSAHLLYFHSEEVRNGENLCGICSMNLSSSTVKEELDHMENIHILRNHLREETILYSRIPARVPQQQLPSTSKTNESSSVSSASDQINKLLEVMPGNLTNININFEDFFDSSKTESGSSSTSEKTELPPMTFIHSPLKSVLNSEVQNKSTEIIVKKRRVTSTESRSSTSSGCIEPAEKKRKINTPPKFYDFYGDKEIDELEIFDEENTQALRKDPDFVPQEEDEEEEDSNLSEIAEEEMEDSDFEVLEKVSLVDRKIHAKSTKKGKTKWRSMMNAQQTNDKIILRIYKLETGKSKSDSSENEVEEDIQTQTEIDSSKVLQQSNSAAFIETRKPENGRTLELDTKVNGCSLDKTEEASPKKTEMSNGTPTNFKRMCKVVLSKIDLSKYDYYDLEKEKIVSVGTESGSANPSNKPIILKLKRKNSTEYLRNSQIPVSIEDSPFPSTSKQEIPPIASTSTKQQNSPIPSTSKEASGDEPKEIDVNKKDRKRTTSLLSTELFLDSSDRMVDFGSDNEDIFHDSLSSPFPVNEQNAPEELVNDYDLDSPLDIDEDSEQFIIVNTPDDAGTEGSESTKGNLVPIYPWCDEESVNFWNKDGDHLRNLMSDSSLVARYKCMSQKCSYHSDQFEEFENHLMTEHKDQKYFLCSSCIDDFTKIQKYLDHVKSCRLLSKYQCSKCMYRGCEQIYLSRHMKQYHNDCELFYLMEDRIDEISTCKKDAKKIFDTKVKSLIQRKCECKLNIFLLL